jgi:hypothetical protein
VDFLRNNGIPRDFEAPFRVRITGATIQFTI